MNDEKEEEQTRESPEERWRFLRLVPSLPPERLTPDEDLRTLIQELRLSSRILIAPDEPPIAA